jgi:hypothetical protein
MVRRRAFLFPIYVGYVDVDVVRRYFSSLYNTHLNADVILCIATVIIKLLIPLCYSVFRDFQPSSERRMPRSSLNRYHPPEVNGDCFGRKASMAESHERLAIRSKDAVHSFEDSEGFCQVVYQVNIAYNIERNVLKHRH